MTPYLSFLLSPFVEQLRGSGNREEGSFGPTELCVVQTLTKSLDVDEGGPYNSSDNNYRRLTLIFVSLPNPNSILARRSIATGRARLGRTHCAREPRCRRTVIDECRCRWQRSRLCWPRSA